MSRSARRSSTEATPPDAITLQRRHGARPGAAARRGSGPPACRRGRCRCRAGAARRSAPAPRPGRRRRGRVVRVQPWVAHLALAGVDGRRRGRRPGGRSPTAADRGPSSAAVPTTTRSTPVAIAVSMAARERRPPPRWTVPGNAAAMLATIAAWTGCARRGRRRDRRRAAPWRPPRRTHAPGPPGRRRRRSRGRSRPDEPDGATIAAGRWPDRGRSRDGSGRRRTAGQPARQQREPGRARLLGVELEPGHAGRAGGGAERRRRSRRAPARGPRPRARTA